MRKFFLLLPALLIAFYANSQQQESKPEGKVTGNFQSDMQYYLEDSIIGAEEAPEKYLMNSYANINYTKGKFRAGIRYEAYLNTMKGFVADEKKNNGTGIPYKFANYRDEFIDVTVGSFYEQYGNGMVLRAYEDKQLGFDNALEGVNIRLNPFKGVYLKGLVGKQRIYFDLGPGIVRGFDGEVYLNDLVSPLAEKKTRFSLGGSFVSRYQKDDNVVYILPENVASYAGRFNLSRGKINLNGEYAHKINDPSEENAYIYKEGHAALINASFSQKGLGILLTAKKVDNMSFRSDRYAQNNDLFINYLPVITKNHAYNLTSIYPYSTQPLGEAGIQADIMYKIKRKTLLGGKYGTYINLNYSRVHHIKKDSLTEGQAPELGYNSDFMGISDSLIYQDINFEISKKISKNFKAKVKYLFLQYNILTLESHVLDEVPHSKGTGNIVNSHIIITDWTYKLSRKKSIRLETQNLFTKKHYGDWVLGLVEFTIPNWFFTVYDQYNYGNVDEDYRVHYLNVAMGYVKNSTRIQLGYGKQREGILCIGGVCRPIPASNGFTVSISSSF